MLHEMDMTSCSSSLSSLSLSGLPLSTLSDPWVLPTTGEEDSSRGLYRVTSADCLPLQASMWSSLPSAVVQQNIESCLSLSSLLSSITEPSSRLPHPSLSQRPLSRVARSPLENTRQEVGREPPPLHRVSDSPTAMTVRRTTSAFRDCPPPASPRHCPSSPPTPRQPASSVGEGRLQSERGFGLTATGCWLLTSASTSSTRSHSHSSSDSNRSANPFNEHGGEMAEAEADCRRRPRSSVEPSPQLYCNSRCPQPVGMETWRHRSRRRPVTQLRRLRSPEGSRSAGTPTSSRPPHTCRGSITSTIRRRGSELSVAENHAGSGSAPESVRRCGPPHPLAFGSSQAAAVIACTVRQEGQGILAPNTVSTAIDAPPHCSRMMNCSGAPAEVDGSVRVSTPSRECCSVGWMPTPQPLPQQRQLCGG